jgi:hypothetical protein
MPDNMHSQTGEVSHSHLFTVRVWHEHLSDNEWEWRGKVEHVPSREGRYFREWSTLLAFLQEILSQQNLLTESDGDGLHGEEE